MHAAGGLPKMTVAMLKKLCKFSKIKMVGGPSGQNEAVVVAALARSLLEDEASDEVIDKIMRMRHSVNTGPDDALLKTTVLDGVMGSIVDEEADDDGDVRRQLEQIAKTKEKMLVRQAKLAQEAVEAGRLLNDCPGDGRGGSAAASSSSDGVRGGQRGGSSSQFRHRAHQLCKPWSGYRLRSPSARAPRGRIAGGCEARPWERSRRASVDAVASASGRRSLCF